MEASRRDATDDWVLPEDSRPPSVRELEARIDVAASRARSAEAAASAIGAAALDAAEQARRSAEAAERTCMLVDKRLGPQKDPASGSPVLQQVSVPPPPPGQASTPDAPTTAIFPAVDPPSVSNGPGTRLEEARSGAAGQTYERDPMRAFIARADRISLRLQKLQSAPLSGF